LEQTFSRSRPESCTFFAWIPLNEGYCVTAVATARHALSELRDREFELVVLDFSLTDGDGLQKTRQLRCEFPLLPILAISGFMVGDMPRVSELLARQIPAFNGSRQPAHKKGRSEHPPMCNRRSEIRKLSRSFGVILSHETK
jgi:Response regulator receiver domain